MIIRLLVAFTLTSFLFSLAHAKEISVFSPHIQTNYTFKKEVKSLLEKKGFKPIFFSKFNEFDNYVKYSKAPAYVKLVSPKEQKDESIKKDYLATSEITYIFLSNTKLVKKKMSDLRLGVVLVEEREVLRLLFEEKLGSKIKLLRTVTKEEDLIPLLIFGSVDVVAVDMRSLDILKKRFNVTLNVQSWKINWGAEALFHAKK